MELLQYCRDHGLGWTFTAYSGANSLVEHGTDQPRRDLLAALQRGY